MVDLAEAKSTRLGRTTCNRTFEMVLARDDGEVGERKVPAVTSSNRGGAWKKKK